MCDCVLFFQSDVMHLTEDSTKLTLFMDVLDGTKAAVSYRSMKYFPVFCDFLFLLLSLVYFLNSWSLFQLTTPTSAPCLRLGSMMATLLLILLKQWRRCVLMPLTSEGPALRTSCRLIPLSSLNLYLQCGSFSAGHPVSPLPYPGECPAG